MNGVNRTIEYKENGEQKVGQLLMLTGGMMSDPIALVERKDGTIAKIDVENIRFRYEYAVTHNKKIAKFEGMN